MHIQKGFIRDLLREGAVISSPNKHIWIAWGKVCRHKSPPTSKYPVLFCADFFLEDPLPWHTFEHYLELSIPEFIELLLPYAGPKLSRLWHNPYKAFFRSTLDDLRKKILLEQLQKAVPYIYQISPTSMSISQLAASLIQACHLLEQFPFYMYGMWNSQEGFLGLTPELLFSITCQDKTWSLQSYALAGTAELNMHDKRASSFYKNQHEHSIVRDEISAALSSYGPLRVEKLEEVVLPSLRHFKTSISCMTHQPPPLESILHKLHPTSALGAYPRERGITWLREYQKMVNRKRYGAPVGYTLGSDKESHMYVAIRNVQWTPSQMRIAAGCGIVAGSRFDDEWYEVNLKLKSIKQALAL